MKGRESLEFDVVIVGAGPAGLSAAIRLRQLAKETKQDISVCVVEKASEIGGHILSGAILEPRALNELIPDWRNKDAPLNVSVKNDSFKFFGKKYAIPLLTPPQMKNHGNYIISLGNFCRWLGQQAEDLGVQIFPGFPAREVLYNAGGRVEGIVTGEFGRGADGQKKSGFQPAMELRGKYTLFAEGCRGSLGKELEDKFNLRENSDPQTYGLGIKELWEISPSKNRPGDVLHTVGWPLDGDVYGGSFVYHMEDNQLSIGLVVGLDYKNPTLSPYQEFQKFKTHPKIKKLLEGGKRISYGARTINEGGWQSIPKLTFPGGALIGCDAGFVNVPKIKGTHTAMKSGMIAAEEIIEHLRENNDSGLLCDYEVNLKNSWLGEELYKSRNIRPSFNKGLWLGLLYSFVDTYIFRGKAPWTFSNHDDHKQLKKTDSCKEKQYDKPDGKITFDILSSVYISNTNHAEDQPCHLHIKNADLMISDNYDLYNSPETKYCPAGVYEIINERNGQKKLQINSQNCLHCKTCDIKDHNQNINWVTPEGGGGPNYPNM